MNFFLFVLFGAVSGFNSNILLNPREFVASIQNADPKIVKQLIDYAHQLIKEGEDTRAAVIGLDDSARAAAAAADAALVKATGIRDHKVAVKDEKTQWLVVKTAELKEAIEQLRVAKLHLEDSTEKFNQADDTMKVELKRIAEEDEDLKTVRTLLNSLMPEFIARSLGRSLLTTVDDTIDPAGVQAVINLVNDLLLAGQKEAEEYTKKRNDAKAVLEAATEDHAEKDHTHTHAVGAESVARQMLKEAQDELHDAEQDVKLKTEEKARKDAAAAAAKQHREAEEKRINSEKDDFEQIIDLLEKL